MRVATPLLLVSVAVQHRHAEQSKLCHATQHRHAPRAASPGSATPTSAPGRSAGRSAAARPTPSRPPARLGPACRTAAGAGGSTRPEMGVRIQLQRQRRRRGGPLGWWLQGCPRCGAWRRCLARARGRRPAPRWRHAQCGCRGQSGRQQRPTPRRRAQLPRLHGGRDGRTAGQPGCTPAPLRLCATSWHPLCACACAAARGPPLRCPPEDSPRARHCSEPLGSRAVGQQGASAGEDSRGPQPA